MGTWKRRYYSYLSFVQMKMFTGMFILLIAKISYCASQDADLSSIESRLLDAELKIDQALISIQAKKLGNNFPEIEGSVPVTSSFLQGNLLPVKRDWFRLPGFDCGNGQVSDGGV